MATLEDYYKDLLRWENEPPRELVHKWPDDLRDEIVSALTDAVSKSKIKTLINSISKEKTNQAAGNKVERFMISNLEPAISDFSILPCTKNGYPDKMLFQQATGIRIPLEVKSTQGWDEKGLRRVLTSSSERLCSNFTAPIYHLLLTAVYSRTERIQDDAIKIDDIRLDFLEPETTVNVRFEASVNHKILADENHHTANI